MKRLAAVLPVPALLAAALALAPAASAKQPRERTYTYDVTYAAKGSYHHNTQEQYDDVWVRTHSSIGYFSWKSTVQRLVVKGNRVKGFRAVSAGPTSARTNISLGESTRTDDVDAGWEEVNCGAKDVWSLESGAATAGTKREDPDDLFVPLVPPNVDLVIRPFEEISVTTGCVQSGPAAVPGETHGGLRLTARDGATNVPLGSGLFDAAFDLPTESIGFGKIIQKVAATPKQKERVNCPGNQEGISVRCDLRWSGTVTFRLRKKS
jgi:hypothetical protein